MLLENEKEELQNAFRVYSQAHSYWWSELQANTELARLTHMEAETTDKLIKLCEFEVQLQSNFVAMLKARKAFFIVAKKYEFNRIDILKNGYKISRTENSVLTSYDLTF